MILIKGHGAQVAGSGDAAHQEMGSACGFQDGEYYDPKTINMGTFDYMFPHAASTDHGAGVAARLDKLADAMLDTTTPETDNSDTPAIFTYLGQFIDHDITAGTDREAGKSMVDVAQPDLAQLSRDEVRATLANLRTGRLDLDSVYGGAAHTGAFGEKLKAALRFPTDRAKMFIGTSFPIEGCRPDLPADIATDLVRLGRITDPENPVIPAAEFEALTGELAKQFLDDTGKVAPAKALIGDMRNDENLAVAQTHLMFLRLHNMIVDEAHKFGLDVSDREAVFTWAQQQTRFIYQWLIINVYLPQICDPEILAHVLDTEAVTYRAFQVGAGDSEFLPLPLEFSVAAFRFGHTQARPSYDWNQIFGRGETACVPAADRADFRLMFQFTGEGDPPMLGVADRLPTNWIPQMERFLNVDDKPFADRNTRSLDTRIAPDLHDMKHAPAGMFKMMRNLPIRNLRRGHLLNIPAAQGCIEALQAKGVPVSPLTQVELTSGAAGPALREGGFVAATPLWFYVLKEAEVQGNGRRLGQLGSFIVAQTLVGLIIHGPDTYWHVAGSDRGLWHPQDTAHPNGHVVDSLPNLAKAVGYL